MPEPRLHTDQSPFDSAPELGEPPGSRVRVTPDGRVAVLLVAEEAPETAAIVQALEQANVLVDWTTSAGELLARTERRELRAPELVFLDLSVQDVTPEQALHVLQRHFPLARVVALGGGGDTEREAALLGLGVATLSRSVNPTALASLALELAAAVPTAPSTGPAVPTGTQSALGHLERALTAYLELRGFSERQRCILRLHLEGHHDKEIAYRCACAESTVYEHWRRMARKSGGSQKRDVIDDFHRFLAQGERNA